MRKTLNHTNCSACTDVLISHVKEVTTSSFVLQMDFSGNALLEPSEQMMIFFHLLLSVYLHYKPSIKPIATDQNILKTLCIASLSFLDSKSYKIPFCDDHNACYTRIMIQSTMKTFLKAFIHEMNEKFATKTFSNVKPKNRKLNLLVNAKWVFPIIFLLCSLKKLVRPDASIVVMLFQVCDSLLLSEYCPTFGTKIKLSLCIKLK